MARKRRYRRKQRNKITLTQSGVVAGVLLFLFAIAHPSSTISISIVVLLIGIIAYSLWAGWKRGSVYMKKVRETSRHMKIAETAHANSRVDFLSSTEFEHYVASVLERLGYGTSVTPPRNDAGIDVILERDGVTTGVQVKKWEGSVGRPELQKLVGAGKNYDRVMCVTNSYFTEHAREYAEEHHVVLVNGRMLEVLAERAFGKDHLYKALSMKIMGQFRG